MPNLPKFKTTIQINRCSCSLALQKYGLIFLVAKQGYQFITAQMMFCCFPAGSYNPFSPSKMTTGLTLY